MLIRFVCEPGGLGIFTAAYGQKRGDVLGAENRDPPDELLELLEWLEWQRMCISLDETDAVVAAMLRWHFSAARGRDRKPRPRVRRLVSMDFAIAPAGTATLPTIDTAACGRGARCPGEAGRLELGGAVWLLVTLDDRGAVQKHGGDEAAIRALATTSHFNAAIGTITCRGHPSSSDTPPPSTCRRVLLRPPMRMLLVTLGLSLASLAHADAPRTELALTIVSGGDEVGSLRVSEAA